MPPFSRLAQRVVEPEVMDDPALEAERHAHALRGLSRINRVSASSRIVWSPLRELARSCGVRRLRVLDLATGGGDIPLALWRRARRAGLELDILGLDVSPRAIEHAQRRAARAGAHLRFQTLDVLGEPLPEGYDVTMCSLFLHHLSRSQAVDLLRRMAEAARRLVVVHDLRRSRTGLWAAELVCRLATTSSVVRIDGPRSVRAAFTPAEARELAQEAGVEGARVDRRWPFRYVLVWRKQDC